VEPRTVAVLGGGPGGLYVARLLRLRFPGCSVDLYEQSAPEETFGFGVGLATRTQRNLEAADAVSFARIVEASWHHEMAMTVGDRRVQLPVGNLIAVARSRLLDVLRAAAEEAGVRLHYGERVTAAALAERADLVVAADGVSSATRDAYADELGAEVVTHDGLYLWAGTDFALPTALFRPVETEFGTFVVHAYPYQADRSTFLVETDEDTWLRAGFDRATEQTPYDESDEHSLRYLSKAFDEDLGGRALIGNRTRWLRFRTVRCRRWHHGRVVLLGDAVHTAHYSIGSGTKLAMEDGIALVEALADAPDVPAALERYEEVRRPAVEHLQETAHRSMRWWDSFKDRLDVPVEQLLVAYMSRAGKVTLDRFAALAPDVVRSALARYAGCPPADVPDDERVAWVLAQGGSFPRRDRPVGDEPGTVVRLDDAWSPEADRLVAGVDVGETPTVLVAGDDGLGTTLTTLDLAERLRRERHAVVATRVPARWVEHVAAALVSDRTDLVELVPAP
jgi:anthraniloyl-CoA monooxygenase